VTVRILLLFNPVGAIAQAVEAVYRVLSWVFNNAARIFSLIETVVNGIANVIAGNIDGMANAVETALVQLISPVIDFLADYMSLGGLPDKIANVIQGFQGWVEGILDTVIGWLAEQGKKLFGIGGEEGQDKKDGKYDGQIGKEVTFTAGKESHRLWIVQQGNNAVVMMASEEKPVIEELNNYENMAKDLQNQDKQGKILKLIEHARQELGELKVNTSKLIQDVNNTETDPKQISKDDDVVESGQEQLKSEIQEIITEIRALGLRPKELEEKKTPVLDKLEEQEQKVTQRYVDSWKTYQSNGGIKPICVYVEGRAARKLGRIAEDPSLEFYSQLNYEGYSKNNEKIEFVIKDQTEIILDKTPERPGGFRIPDIFRAGQRVGDVKRVQRLSLDSQMRDNVRIARGDNVRLEGASKLLPPSGRFDLIVRSQSDDLPNGTHVSGPLKEAVEATGGYIFEIL
jgi:hypothetical protein